MVGDATKGEREGGPLGLWAEGLGPWPSDMAFAVCASQVMSTWLNMQARSMARLEISPWLLPSKTILGMTRGS